MCHIALATEERRESAVGYKPTWTGLVEARPSSHELHALITPPDILHMTSRPGGISPPGASRTASALAWTTIGSRGSTGTRTKPCDRPSSPRCSTCLRPEPENADSQAKCNDGAIIASHSASANWANRNSLDMASCASNSPTAVAVP